MIVNEVQDSLRDRVVGLLSYLMFRKTATTLSSSAAAQLTSDPLLKWMEEKPDLTLNDIEKVSKALNIQPVFSVQLPRRSHAIKIEGLEAKDSVDISLAAVTQSNNWREETLRTAWKNNNRPRWMEVVGGGHE